MNIIYTFLLWINFLAENTLADNMALFSLRRFLHWTSAGKEPHPNLDTVIPTESQTMWPTLTDLSIEILRLIADTMPTEDAVSFALCVRKLYENVGPELLTRLVYDDQAWTKFLDVYRRDRSPHLMSCGVCHCLHAVPQRESGPCYTNREKRKCSDVSRHDESAAHFHERFGFGDVQVLVEI